MEFTEQLYQGMVEAAPDAIVAVTEDGTIVLVNAQTEALFGYGRDELIGQPVEVLVPATARRRHVDLRDGYFGEPSTRPMGVGMELTGRRRDGTEFPAEISLSAIEISSGLLVSASIRDGTERKQAAIVSSSRDAIISTDLNGLITSWNPGAEALHGWTAAEVLGRHVRRLAPPDERAEFGRIFDRVLAWRRPAERETLRLRADGVQVHVHESMAPIFDANGASIGVSSTARDITELRRIRVQRQQLEDRLHQSERLESLGQLAGGVAHDFNNLLAVILNYTTFVAEEVVGNEAASQDIEEIRSAAERAVRLTQQLLIFARREARQPETLDLDEVVADVESLLSRTLGEHVELVVHRSPVDVHVRTDRGQLEQLLLNLAVNARDAMTDGGTLTIETATIEVSSEPGSSTLSGDLDPGTYVQLSVSDTGSGMDDETVAHAFEPFFTTKPKGSGTGLGLATVYGIVTEAGGTAVIYSEVGLGTTIRVYLPESRDAVAGPSAPPGEPLRQGTGQRILVVEDEAAIRRVAARLLARNGFEVLEAEDGAQALALAADHPPDLLLTDVVMPQMSGRELAAQLAELGRAVPTVFMSGYSEGVLGPHRHLDPGVALVQKPFTERQLVALVNAVLQPM